MRTLIIVVALTYLTACSIGPDFQDQAVLNTTMTFNWNSNDPCVLDSIDVGSDYQCSNNTHPTYDDACVGKGRAVRLRSNLPRTRFEIYFSPWQSPKSIGYNGGTLTVARDVPIATYKYTVVNTSPSVQCEDRPVDPHVRVIE